MLHVLVNRDNDMISQRMMMMKILFAFKLVLIISEEAFRKNERVILPTLNKLMHYQDQVRNKIPFFRKQDFYSLR